MASLDVFIGLISGIASVRWWIDGLRVWQKRKAGDNKSNKKRHNYSFILNEWIHVSSFLCPPLCSFSLRVRKRRRTQRGNTSPPDLGSRITFYTDYALSAYWTFVVRFCA